MGYSGRFYITNKNGFQIVHLNNDHAIKITYNATNNSFGLYDEKGNSYVFDVKETTHQVNDTEQTPFNGFPQWGGHTVSDYVSAFQLSTVYDPNGEKLIEFKYNTTFDIVEKNTDFTTTTNNLPSENDEINMLEGQCYNQSSVLEPRVTKSMSSMTIKTKKLVQINVVDYAKIDFSMSADRTDTDNEGSYKLNEILISNKNGELLKKVTLKYDYNTIPTFNKKRLILTKVTDVYGNEELPYSLFYKAYPEGNQSMTKDYWGYLSSVYEAMPGNDGKEANPLVTASGVLQKMILPTGGAIVYDFEPNNYSYIGDQSVTNFDNNPMNWTSSEWLAFGSTTGGIATAGGVNSDIIEQRVKFYGFNVPDNSSFFFKEYQGDVFIENAGGCSYNTQCEFTRTLLPGRSLRFYYQCLTIGGSQGGFKYTLFKKKTDPFKFLYGGGIRIKRVGYFEDGNVYQDYYDNPDYQQYFTPSKEKKYSYTMFDDALKSSGSLVFPKPVYDYQHTKSTFYQCTGTEGQPQFFWNSFTYNTHTSFDNLKTLRTKGADIGYKNVQVTETGNGYTRYEYKSPIDEPESNYSITYPFTRSTNVDYRRGLLSKESVYDQSFKKLTETEYTYQYTDNEYESKSGYRIYGISNCPLVGNYPNATGYISAIQNCETSSLGLICGHCDYPGQYIAYGEVNEAVGWAKLTNKTNRNYFYNGSTLQGTVETKEEFTYNDANKKIASHKTYTYGTSETAANEYTYYNNTTTNNIANIQQIVSKKNNAVISTQKVIYSTINFKPIIIQGSKDSLGLENKIQFVKYDNYCNVLDVKRENGTPIAYIWGYNKTQPIAMIEGMGYDSVIAACQTQVNAAVTESDSQTVSETNLITKLNAIRTALPNVMVTTYTYKPLVGVTSITDPKGLKTTYFYDSLGRLAEVRDQDNKLLSENKYNYRPQPEY